MFIRNAWYVAGWAGEIAKDAILARKFLDEPVILYRTASGAVTALADRCCHRHAPLSKGRLEGEAVRCMYHGLKFDPSGRCIEIPGEANVPSKYKVRTYPVVEKDSVVWIWMGEAARADPAAIVDWPFLADPAWARKEGYLHYDADYLLIVDNILDFSHLPYVHENTIGTAAFAQNRPTFQNTDYGMHIDNTAYDDMPSPHFKKLGGFTGQVDRWNIYDFHIKGNLLLMDAGSAPAGEGGPKGDRGNAIEFRHFTALTPETETTTHYHFAHPRNFKLDDRELDDQVLNMILTAFTEDKEIIEAQQRVIDTDTPHTSPMMAISADGPVYRIRRTIDRIIAEEQPYPAAAE
jgi:phenylpropionate dioxygenase-like ring-hydroxylating dioxygenase large terminal subunit